MNLFIISFPLLIAAFVCAVAYSDHPEKEWLAGASLSLFCISVSLFIVVLYSELIA